MPAPSEHVSAPAEMGSAALITLLSRYRFRGMVESDYQNAIEGILTANQVPYRREVNLTPRDRIDFLLGTLGLEVKDHDTRASIIRQLGRYAHSKQINHLVLASTKVMLTKNMPESIHGVPLTVLALRGAVL